MMKTTTAFGTGVTFLAGAIASLFVATAPEPVAVPVAESDHIVTGSVMIRPVLSPEAVKKYREGNATFITEFEDGLNEFAMNPLRNKFGKLPRIPAGSLQNPDDLFEAVAAVLAPAGLVPVKHTGFAVKGFAKAKSASTTFSPGAGYAAATDGEEDGDLSYIWVDDIYICIDTFEVEEMPETAATTFLLASSPTGALLSVPKTVSKKWIYEHDPDEPGIYARLTLQVALIVGSEL